MLILNDLHVTTNNLRWYNKKLKVLIFPSYLNNCQSSCFYHHILWQFATCRVMVLLEKGVRSYVPRVLCSPGPMFPHPMFPSTYVPRHLWTLVLYSPVPMFPSTYIPRYLCSPVLSSPVPMFPGTYVPRTYVPRYLCSPVPMFPRTYVPL